MNFKHQCTHQEVIKIFVLKLFNCANERRRIFHVVLHQFLMKPPTFFSRDNRTIGGLEKNFPPFYSLLVSPLIWTWKLFFLLNTLASSIFYYYSSPPMGVLNYHCTLCAVFQAWTLFGCLKSSCERFKSNKSFTRLRFTCKTLKQPLKLLKCKTTYC